VKYQVTKLVDEESVKQYYSVCSGEVWAKFSSDPRAIQEACYWVKKGAQYRNLDFDKVSSDARSGFTLLRAKKLDPITPKELAEIDEEEKAAQLAKSGDGNI
jgi:hypothetical protein